LPWIEPKKSVSDRDGCARGKKEKLSKVKIKIAEMPHERT
jgi:hypothetical protein